MATNDIFLAMRTHIVDSLERASGDDENLEALQDRAQSLTLADIDSSTITRDDLFADPLVQAAFKKFIDDVIGGFQYVAELNR
jgi:hypothetical protein